MSDTLHLKAFTEADLQQIWEIGYREEWPEWKNYSAPYFDDYQAFDSFEAFKECDDYHFLRLPSVQGIFIGEKPIGMVSYYWENEKTRWLEMGIIIYDAAYWGGGYGTQALTLWTEHIFATIPELEHIGLTTWSGNQRMMKAAEKLGMTKEAQIRKVRYWQGVYYDSVKYGILREEWKER
ncbi:GNAT family N-acetyltransferase [Streptococcus cuniculi]|uniref:GNAT family N-acetyltransferase n=1 Tax=Streptococcus cuniculi TaxID=1432788 RepID=A0A1Q8E6D8_9STRE|nr:GNAT family protein [Streptococcus cuniculi]OLF47351.1 GNAT family N-acetyltransferase [Streptococcus cuniculi]